MILLKLISWPYHRRHVLRTALTTAGIVLGVSVFVGMHAANQSVLAAFAKTVDSIAGKTELQVSAGETGFGEEILEKVQSATTVRAAAPVIEAIVDSNLPGQGNLLVLAIDMTGDRTLREYDLDGGETAIVDDPLIFLAQPDSLIVSSEFASRSNLHVGSSLRLGTVEGEKAFTIRGIIKTSGLASAFGGNLAIMDIYAAQKMFGRGRTFDRIDIAVKPDATLADCQRELEGLLGPAFEIQPPSGRGHQFESMLAAYSQMVSISSGFALFIGMFLVFNAFATAATQRRSEIGILRAIGATRGQIRWLFLAESAIMGLTGSILGLLLGNAIARAIASPLGALITNFFRTTQNVDNVTTAPWLLGLALVLGVVTSIVAAALPARNAARLDPIQALQKGRLYVLTQREGRLRTTLASILGLVAFACLQVSGSRLAFYAGYLAVLVASLLLGPFMSLAVAKAIRPVLKWFRPVEGTLAADSLIQSPRRTSGSVIALMLSVALVVAFEGMGRANYNSIIEWAETVLNPDLFVVPSQSLDIKSARFPATMESEIAGLPGIERVQALRNGRITFQNRPTMVVVFDMSSMLQTVHRQQPVAGTIDGMYQKSAAGEGLIVSDNLSQLRHLALGDIVEIAAPYGVIRLPIVGIIVDYSDQQGSILMDRKVFAKYWRDDSASMFRVYVQRQGSIADVRRAIFEHYAGKRQVFVLTNAELKHHIVSVIGQWFGLTSIQIAVAVLVAILGIINTLTVSITDRRRELGVLRAIGAVHGQVRGTIWIEAVSVAAIGLILGFALGAINLFYVLEIIHRDVAGLRLDYDYPVKVALWLLPIMFVAAFVASVWPAESAVRGSLVEALEYE
jgi:putative ABC transport system permease protein